MILIFMVNIENAKQKIVQNIGLFIIIYDHLKSTVTLKCCIQINCFKGTQFET